MKLGNFKILKLSIFFLLLPTISFSQENYRLSINTQPKALKVEIFKDGQLVKKEFIKEGKIELELPKGNYKLNFSCGFEYKPEILDVQVNEDKIIEVKLKRIINMNEIGWFSGDAHLHSRFSDGAQKFPVIVSGAKSEGLNWIASTDHNEGCWKAWDHLQKYNYNTDDFLVIFGEEVSPYTSGHFNAIGIEGYVPYLVNDICEIFDKAHFYKGIIFVNHPFAELGIPVSIGKYFFSTEQLGGKFCKNFDGIEVLNGGWNLENEEALRYWYKLLNSNYKYFAIANTDNHNIYNEPLGSPRTYVYLKDKKLNKENVISALKNCEAFLTNGPLITKFEINGAGIGKELKINKNDKLNVEMEIVSIFPLKELRLVRNGFIYYRNNKLNGNEHKEDINLYPLNNSWCILIVFTQDGRVAITNPIWMKFKK